MKRILCLILAALLLLSLVACGGETEEAPKETTYVSKYVSEKGFTELHDKVSWEGINAIPVKKPNMDIDEARQICVDFFRYAKTATWIPDADYGIWADATLDHTDPPKRHLDNGVVYGGLPYISWGTGSIYRLMDFIDEETGVVDVTSAGAEPLYFGNQCANGAYVGFARVINSAAYGITAKMVHKDGFLRLGDYTYADDLKQYTKDYNTTKIISENLEAKGEDVMYEAYALLQHGDGLVYWTTAGHVIMVATDPVVVRGADGRIDPAQSYLTIIDQGTQFYSATGPNGDQYQYQESVDAKKTFLQLLSGNYLPFTFAEWLGTDPIEETEVTFSHQGDTITREQLFGSTVTTNYYLFDIYAQVFDNYGNEVYKVAVRSGRANTRQLSFKPEGEDVDTWGSLDNLSDKREYTVKVYCQIGTGERPVLWEGKLER